MISTGTRKRLKKEVETIIKKYSWADINLLVETIDEELANECGSKLDHEVFAILEELELEEQIELARSRIIWIG